MRGCPPADEQVVTVLPTTANHFSPSSVLHYATVTGGPPPWWAHSLANAKNCVPPSAATHEAKDLLRNCFEWRHHLTSAMIHTYEMPCLAQLASARQDNQSPRRCLYCCLYCLALSSTSYGDVFLASFPLIPPLSAQSGADNWPCNWARQACVLLVHPIAVDVDVLFFLLIFIVIV